MFGQRPYMDILPADNLFTSIVANGEGWHNFHHVYPYDYALAEHNWWVQWNPSKMVIDFMWLIGQAYGFKRKVVKQNHENGQSDSRKRSNELVSKGPLLSKIPAMEPTES